MTELSELASLARMNADPGQYDWTAVTAALGAMPPPDYVNLINTYGGGLFDGELVIFEPGASIDTYDLLREGLYRVQDVEELWSEDPDLPRPAPLTRKRLINWAGTPGAEYLYWVIGDGAPSASWTVAVEQGEDNRWEFFDLTTVDFLHGILTGDVNSQFLSWFGRQSSHSYSRY
jgi:hypothetical protein